MTPKITQKGEGRAPEFGTVGWALDQPIQHSGAKLLFVVLVRECAGNATCAPSIRRLCELTANHRRTIGIHLAYLEATGWISRRLTRRYGVITVHALVREDLAA
jgi:pyocin large subunit-like protein